MKIKILEKVCNGVRYHLRLIDHVFEQLPDLQPPEAEDVETFKFVSISSPFSLSTWIRFPETEKISPPLLQLNEVTFGYSSDSIILKKVSFDVGLDSRIAIVGANGAGKSTL
jgi:ATP-binding cassette subfamily F protein 3